MFKLQFSNIWCKIDSLKPQSSTLNPQPTTDNPQPTTDNPQPTTENQSANVIPNVLIFPHLTIGS